MTACIAGRWKIPASRSSTTPHITLARNGDRSAEALSALPLQWSRANRSAMSCAHRHHHPRQRRMTGRERDLHLMW